MIQTYKATGFMMYAGLPSAPMQQPINIIPNEITSILDAYCFCLEDIPKIPLQNKVLL